VLFHNFHKIITLEPDVLCDYLIEIGACSAYVVDADRGTSLEQPIFLEPGLHPYYEKQKGDDDTTSIVPIWNRCNVTAHFPSSIDLNFVIELLQESDFFTTPPTVNDNDNNNKPSSIIHSIERVPNKDWIVHVQQEWKPIIVANRFLLRFPWHNDTIVQSIIDDYLQDTDSSNPITTSLQVPLVPLKLQGGIAFGTGEHATTQLCLQWLGTILDDRKASQTIPSSTNSLKHHNEPISLIDYGSGSGILGLGAYAYGQQNNINITCIGIDLDIDSCRIANENSIINNIPMKNYLPLLSSTINDNESTSLLLKASTKINDENDEQIPMDIVNNQYDICVANILAGPLITLATTLSQLTKRNGQLGLSGILSHQADSIINAYTNAGFHSVQVSNQIGDWILITGIRS
jgi:ribosomal protein L11 methylase PrmA